MSRRLRGRYPSATIHWLRGTPELLLSIAVSASFTLVSTSFNYFAMRRGLLTVGQGSQGLLRDLAQMPRCVAIYCLERRVSSGRHGVTTARSRVKALA